jgi:hypothetical protein
MPGLPDLTLYLEALDRHVAGGSLSRLLKVDWPRTLDKLEKLRRLTVTTAAKTS